jgi:hypothetical protein
MEQVLFGMVCQCACDLICTTVGSIDRVEPEQLTGLALERADHEGSLARIAIDIKGRRVVAVYSKRRRILELGGEDQAQIGIDLALLRVGAGYIGAVAICRRRRPTNKMVVLVCGDDEQRIVPRDPGVGETLKEFPEGLVVGGESLNVSALAGPEGSAARKVIVMGVRDVSKDDRHAGLKHCRQITERL